MVVEAHPTQWRRGAGGGRGAGGTTQYVRGNYKSFKGENLTGCRRNAHQFNHPPAVIVYFF